MLRQDDDANRAAAAAAAGPGSGMSYGWSPWYTLRLKGAPQRAVAGRRVHRWNRCHRVTHASRARACRSALDV